MFFNQDYEVPYLTVFIGGNHEASNVLQENFFGGYLCDKIYYMGKSGVINYKGIRIAGLSGIFNQNNFKKGHFEDITKIDKSSVKSIYHVREYDICKLALMDSKIDIFLSHDWPTNIVLKEDYEKIYKIKKWNDVKFCLKIVI